MKKQKNGSDKKEIALISGLNDKDRMNKNTWIGETGASSRITNFLEGMYDLNNSEGYVKVGDKQFIKIKYRKFIYLFYHFLIEF